MIHAPILENEAERLKEVRALNLLDTPPEERFERLIRLAKTSLKVPIAFVALLDDQRQWFKAECGMGVSQTARKDSFCAHAIAGQEMLIVEDATKDPRFANSPLVKGCPNLRFYAGRPLRGPGGRNVGTFCVSDTVPREFSAHEEQMLNDFADVAERELQMVDALEIQSQLLKARQALDAMQLQVTRELNEASSYICAQLPPRLDHHQLKVDWKFVASSHLGGDMFGYFPIDDSKWVIYLLDVAGHGIGSSLLASTVSHEITGRNLPNTDFSSPSDAARALNQAFPMQQHQNKFFTMWYGVYDSQTRELSYTTAGHHAGLLLGGPQALAESKNGANGKRVAATASKIENSVELWQQNLMIGVNPDVVFSTDTVYVEPGQQLFIFSDGVFEVGFQNKKMLGYERLRKELEQSLAHHKYPAQAIFDFVADWQQSTDLTDDFSVLHVTMP